MNLREWALPVYTILVQMAIGMLLILWLMSLYGRKKYGDEAIDQIIRNPLLIILVTTIFGMIGGHFHLSKPYLSFLAVSNLYTSWLSREILFTLLFFFTVGILLFTVWYRKGKQRMKSAIGWLAILFGFVTVYCMGRIYLLPAQAAWNTPETIVSYYGSMVLLGVMAMAAILIMDLRFMEIRQKTVLTERAGIVSEAIKRLAVAAGVLLVPVLLINLYHLYMLRTGTDLARTSYDLLMELYKPLLITRFLMLVAGVGTLILTVALMKRNGKTVQDLFTASFWACLLVIVGEVLGRFLFYAAHIRTGL